jgi:hypothetical protein
MKHSELHAIVHNMADSMGCGNGFMVGGWSMDVYGEAAKSPEGHLTLDFLTGDVSGAKPSASLMKAFNAYLGIFPEFCIKHGASESDFRSAVVRFSVEGVDQWAGARFVVTIEDTRGKRSSAEYTGLGGQSTARPERHNSPSTAIDLANLQKQIGADRSND